MGICLFAEALLEKEIKKLDVAERTEDTEFLKSQYQKELEVLRRLNIDLCNIAGELDAVIDRLEKKHIYFMDPENFVAMKVKAIKYDGIKKIIDEEE